MAAFGTVAIANGEANSNALELPEGHALTSVKLPSAFTGATIALHGSHDGADWRAIYLDGAAVTITVTVSTTHQINPRATFGLKSVKLVSASNEADARTIETSIGKVI